MLEDTQDADLAIALPNVSQDVLKRVIEWCTHHQNNPAAQRTDAMDPWNKKFCGGETPDQTALFDLILAANYLNIKELLDITCQTVANMIKGKSPKEIRQTFGVDKEFTPEEEECVRKEYPWIEER